MKHAVFSCFLGLVGCSTSAGGPEYITFSVGAIEDTGPTIEPVCTPMPIMPGAHVVNDLTFGGAFTAEVDATRERIDVTFGGISAPDLANRSLPRDTLLGGYAVTDLRVETLSGRRFTVSLVSPCPAETTP